MTRKVFLFEILLIAVASVATAAAYPHLPARVATHWNIHLRPDGYSPKWALFLFGPGVMSGIALFTGFGPWLSPKNFEVDSFRSTWRQIMLIMFCLMTYFYAAILWAGAGHRINIGRVVIAGICVLFALMGNLLGKVRRNFYMGVRTPWTLASERVWNATHRFAAKTVVAGGLLGLVLSIASLYPWAMIVLLAGALAPVIYSLVFYKQLERRGEL